ncbi:MAG: hypothetical protein OEY63_05375 [Gemmatimonadota bacterium]|nr:hypothetical protein [Gemmatimonadota bacterium]
MLGKLLWTPTLTAALVAVQGLEAQAPKVSTAELNANLSGSRVDVSIRYTATTFGSDTIVPFATVTLANTKIEDITIAVDDQPSALGLEVDNDLRIEGTAAIPASYTGGEISIAIKYSVTSTEWNFEMSNGAIHIPILGIQWPPSETLPNTFSAEVTLPSRMVVYDTFPSRMPQSNNRAETTNYRTSLNVVPGALIFRWSTGKIWFTTNTMVNAVVLTVFFILGVIGVRQLKKEALT